MLLIAAAACGLLLGPWLARVGPRAADRYRDPPLAARPSAVRVVVVTAALAVLLAGAAALTGARPALVALAWAACAGVVLAQVDLAVHRLPDRVVHPATAAVAAAYLVDALALGTWEELLRAVLAGAAAFAGGAVAAAVSPGGLGFGDVKLLGLLGVLLGWFGWSVLAAGVLLGLGVGALVALGLLVARRAAWRTAIALGPSLLAGAVLALALAGP